jgi:hypothetical protein
VRRLLSRDARVVSLVDWTDAPAEFDAAVYPSLLVAERSPTVATADTHAPVRVEVHGAAEAARFAVGAASLAFDRSPGAPWLLVPPRVRVAFDRLREAGEPLGESGVARPVLGVKCGCNEAFVVRVVSVHDDLALVRAGLRTGHVERALLRPLVRGETLAAHAEHPASASFDGAEWGGEHIVWTHDDHGRPLDRLPPHAERWLEPWRRTLAARTDARGAGPWWAVFRTEGALLDRPRVVWSDFGRRPHAIALPVGAPHVPLNSCYVARCGGWTDAQALAALLGAEPIAAWLNVLAEPARGGYHRYLAWTLAQLPLPRDWARARACLASTPLSSADATARVAAAYALDARELAPLVEWDRGGRVLSCFAVGDDRVDSAGALTGASPTAR